MHPNATQPAERPAQIRALLDQHPAQQDRLLPALHAIQDALGFIPPECLADVALRFNLSRAEVHGVLTFYHHFRDTAPARHTLQLCRAEACQSMGGNALLARAEAALGCRLHQISADGRFALEPVYCLGLCATAPSLVLDGTLHARVTPARLERLLAGLKESA
ncbi:MAG: formate dehydrogenase subunit gamma [Pseudomonadota bacterium]